MLLYAPAELRRRRRVLVPSLAAGAACAFASLVLLPGYEEAPVANLAAIMLLAAAFFFLTLLLNGDPLTQHEGFKAAVLDKDNEVGFVARYTVEGAQQAQSDFWRRSVRELRLGEVLLPPVALAIAAVGIAKMGEATTAAFFALFALLSFVSPLVRLYSGRRLAAARARMFPERRVRVAREGIAVGEAGEGLAWSNVARVWEFDQHLTFVINPYVAIQLPKADIPEEARKVIAAATPAPS